MRHMDTRWDNRVFTAQAAPREPQEWLLVRFMPGRTLHVGQQSAAPSPCGPTQQHLHVGLAASVVEVASPAVPRAAHAEGLLELVLALSHAAVVKRQLLTRRHITDCVQRHSQLAARAHNNSLAGQTTPAQQQQQQHSQNIGQILL